MNNQAPILILGAGAAGLMAARTLALAGQHVLVLEAQDRLGGRIHTVPIQDGSGVVELGAEFIHGRLPITLGLVEEAGLTTAPVVFDSHQPGPDGPEESDIQQDEPDDPIALVFGRMDRLGEEDMSFEEFLDRHVAEPELEWARHAARRYVQGFDAADPARVSAQALRRESEAEDMRQFRIAEGYGRLIDFLAATPYVQIVTGHIIEQIIWQQGQVHLLGKDAEGRPVEHIGRAAILTPSLGVWQAAPGSPGALSFEPALPDKQAAIADLGFGPALKIIVEGRTRFWQDRIGDGGFIFLQDGPFEVWWTPDELPFPLLTAWSAGPPAQALALTPPEALKSLALNQLASVLQMSEDELRTHVVTVHIAQWGTEPYTRGAYSWELAHIPDARQRLKAPVAGTLFFAGEATYTGPHPGTVEAALDSGKRAALELLTALLPPA